MPHSHPARRAATIVAAALILLPPALSAQTTMRHMEFTALRPSTAADTARALALVRFLRQALAPYASLDSAEAAGYRLRPNAADLPRKALVHVGNPAIRRQADTTFDPARPQALLYRQGPNGRLTLAGAMYVALPGATLDQLDARVPLSLAHWHRHINVCLPRPGTARTAALRRAETPEACEQAGGRFRSESPRYMVHVMIDAGDDLARAFPQGQDGAMSMRDEFMPMMGSP